MGWITPVITWVAGNGIGFSDLNRIEGDLKYLREENKTINGTNTFSGNITQSGGVSSFKATTIFDTGYSLLTVQRSGTGTPGVLLRNTGTGTLGQVTGLTSGGVGLYDGTNLLVSVGSLAISLLKPVTITGALTIDDTAGITAISDIKLLQDTSITGTLGISEIVTFAKGLNIGGTINPTTAPTESTEPTINGHNATQLIPRGAYYIKCSVTKEATVSNDTATIFLQRNIDGLWTTLVSTTTVNVTSASTSTVLASGVQFSSGTNMRINIQQSGFSPSGFVILSKT